MDERLWKASGPEFTLFWGGRDWTLNVYDPCGGLRLKTGESRLPQLLALDRLGASNRCDLKAFTRDTLVAFEEYRSSVRATYAPSSWGGIQVCAAWIAAAHDAVDLEIQLSASSVGELKGLEVGVHSRLDPATPEDSNAPVFYVEARDPAAVLSVGDGREPDLRRCQFTVLSGAKPLRPSLHLPHNSAGTGAVAPGLFYTEMVHPDDLFRRVLTEPIPAETATVPGVSIRYALFGLELEKGVILRARLRGQWFHSADPEQQAASLFQDFLRQPPPLGP